MRTVTRLSLSVLAVAALLSGCKSSTTPVSAPVSGGAPAGSSQQGPMSPGDAGQLLATLPVKAGVGMAGYSRDKFGTAWTDDNDAPGGHNKCDTRNDILRRDLTDVAPAAGCQIQSGTLHDPYTGKTIGFERGPKSTTVQIDHMVPLGDAWETGAQQLSVAQRTSLANDPRNLMAVDGPTNEAKGDGDAAEWLPPVASFRCVYVEHQIQVKSIYGLWVTQAERDAMDHILHSC
ncbi:HNH endonuclease family protein [Nocardia sp. alder85J]|uniref:HNH endonuclease family protein n=1 Tax=Nocardia sp. alder85J TaxID=2862949 RepID=UPI001CD778D1|nr:HNH endonuclease family protein [Nocardia sp. alder85J]MCX4092931.1 HNH endonuclease family protein [Nocardia sp. alder85J]